MERHYFGLATLLASVALLIWSIGETFAYPQGPNVSLGANPIVSFTCSNNNNNSYTVPSDMELIITDLLSESSGSHPLQVDGTTLFNFRIYSNTYVDKHHSFSTGFKAPAGTTVTCTQSNELYVSGYLAHQ